MARDTLVIESERRTNRFYTNPRDKIISALTCDRCKRLVEEEWLHAGLLKQIHGDDYERVVKEKMEEAKAAIASTPEGTVCKWEESDTEPENPDEYELDPASDVV
jgi:hypothetical protein